MTLDISVGEVLGTTRSVRKRLDWSRPVPREVILDCLELALQAPTGSNSQEESVGIPADDYAQGGLFPIAYTKGTDFNKANRLPADQVTSWDAWRW